MANIVHFLRFRESAYSPDFNPIEMAFSKFRALLRAKAARTIPDL